MHPIILAGSHDHYLVALSVLIAVVASYTALDLAGRIRASSGVACHAWLATAAIAMGGGIWAMHFVAMLAFSIPGMEMQYDLLLTLVSLIVPILVTGVGFHVVGHRDAGPVALGLSGLLMGLGIVAMHYTGMAAMRMAADLRYDKLWVAVSILIALGAATVALWLAFKKTGLGQKLVAAVAMGLAISGMHYAAMQAAVFTAHSAVDRAEGYASLGQVNLALAVAGATFLILFMALVAAMFDRRFALLAEREARALRESEERFRALYRRTPLPLHSLDADGLIEQVSDAWLDLLGHSRNEVIGRSIADFMTRESAERRIAVDWPRLLETGALKDVEYQLLTKHDDILDVLLTSTVERDRDGSFVRALGGLIDITARKRAEGALQQSQKMEVVGQLTGGMAHDFNNLLAVIIAHLDLLRKRLPEDSALMPLVDQALQGATRGASLTQRMLSFARRQDLKPEPVDVPSLVRGMADLLQRSIGPTIRIETRFPLHLRRAQVDAHQLELAIMNLVVNARDAMPEGGAITIAADESVAGSIPGLLPGAYLRLSVTDSGEGMDEATLAKAAEPFFTTKGVGRGTGLGLSMVHGLAEQSGGKLVLKSRKGEGTSAEIWLPAFQTEVKPASNSSAADKTEVRSEAISVRPLSVLVVDDDVLVLAGTAAMLEDLGHRVVTATSGQEALEALTDSPGFDLVITDQAMPGMTGVQLAEAISAKWPHLSIILATGYAELPLGTDPMLFKLNKPFFASALAAAIADVLRRKSESGKVLRFRRETAAEG